MKHHIGVNMKDCHITIAERCLPNFTKLQLLKELFNSHKFRSGQNHRTIWLKSCNIKLIHTLLMPV